ncbi:MAG: zinc metallopeptidase [Clostridiaceae bacterium]|nr:zinc metallopeptidase [Clostridiaceae bacterium]
MEAFWNFFYSWGLILLIGTVVFSLIASISTRVTFNKYSKVPTSRGVTGHEAAQYILRINRLSSESDYESSSVQIERVAGKLTDHYSPKEKILRLSEAVYDSTSIAAVGVAAHECGHAIQDAHSFLPNKIREILVPLANIGSRFGPYMAIFGLVFTAYIGQAGETIATIGIILFAFAVLFYLVTLPVEFDASRRAIRILSETNVLTEDELKGAKKVLRAASMTYVAAAASALITLLRLIAMRRK